MTYLLESNKSCTLHESHKSYWLFKYLNPQLILWNIINLDFAMFLATSDNLEYGIYDKVQTRRIKADT
jgi:hypothetical protein